jgi:CRISPR-associated protein Cas1
MKKLLNTLYVTLPDVYLSLDGENIVIKQYNDSDVPDAPANKELLRVPLHNLENIVIFGYRGSSPALMGKCMRDGIGLSFLSTHGRFLASVVGEQAGNVLLRRKQYRVADDETCSLAIARNMVIGKLYNCRWVLERASRDHAMRVDSNSIKHASGLLAAALYTARDADSLARLRGIEGDGAATYFSVFDELILQNKDCFQFDGRSRRPPMDKVNAMLSFAYSLLAAECASALSAVGLDPFVGMLHTDRPGRRSLALDLMEELRSVFADRFVLSTINNRQMSGSDFLQKESGAVMMTNDARKAFLTAWQTRKQDKIEHPFIKEKIEWGLVPHVQALLLARHLRGDLDEYPPFMWK